MQSQVRDESADEGEIDFRRIVAIVSDNRWLILAVSGVFLLLSIIYVNFATPIYEANALVEVESQAHDLSNLSQLTSELGSSDQDSNTEVDIIQSRQVLGQAVDQEGLTVTVSPVGLWGLPFFTKNSPSDISVGLLSVPDELEAEDIELVVGRDGSYSVDTSDGVIGQGRVGELLSTEHGDFKLLVSRLAAAPGSRFKLTHLPRMMAIKTLFKDLKVEKDSKTSSSGTIVLTLDGANKNKTISIVQSVANAYVAQNIRWRAEEANKSLDFLRDQLPKVKADLYKSEEALNSYRLKNGSLDMDMEVKNVLEEGALLQQQLGDLAVKQAEISHLYLPQHPVYKALLDERASVERQQESLKQRVADLPDSQQKLLRLTRDVEVNEQLYLQMFQKIQELDVESAGTVGNVRIIDNADAEWKPVRPKKLLVVALAIFLGAFSGFALSLVRTILNPGIEGAEELESIGMPVLAIVPLSEEQQKVEREQKRSFGRLKKGSISQGRQQKYLLGVIRPEDLAIESLRGLRTSVHFSMMSARNKVLMISGPSPLVGKSFISSNLAVVLAQSGQKVLIIDADMRRGTIHELFGLPPHVGLSELLSGRLPRDAVIKSAGIMGLDVIGRGSAPENPAELLLRSSLNELLDWANDNYDIILVDTPPIMAVTDAAIVGRLAGITLLVVRHRINSIREIQLTSKRFVQNGISLTGYVLNGLKYEASYGYYKYGYYSYKYKSDEGEGFKS